MTKKSPDTAREPLPGRANRDERWWARAHQIQKLADQLGRLPRLSDGCDPALVTWIKNQRRAPDLDPTREAMLERLPGWSRAPHDDHWDDRLDELERFLARHRRTPRVRAHDPAERALAHWLTRQHRALNANRLSHYRLQQLEQITAAIR